MDTHKDTIAVAVLRTDEVEPDRCTTPNTPEAIRKLVARLGGPSQLLACYESGPTGYDTYRILQDLGVHCDVIAPALIPRCAGQRVKTDQLDARNLARLHRAGELTTIRIPSPQEEALRDFIRVREDFKADLRRARQRIRGLLGRQGRRYSARTARWGKQFTAWVRTQRFSDPTLQSTFNHLLAELDTRTVHLVRIPAKAISRSGVFDHPSVGAAMAATMRSGFPLNDHLLVKAVA